jgi:hypothetical protein
MLKGSANETLIYFSMPRSYTVDIDEKSVVLKTPALKGCK